MNAAATASTAAPKSKTGIGPVLHLAGITKRFPAVTALDKVDFEVRAGEVHALLGENGAGKSTLMKILDGMHSPNEGHIYLDGQMIDPASPLEAKKAGIVLIHQELSLVPQMTVAENIFLGSLPVKWPGRLDRATLYAKAGAILERLESDFAPADIVESLSIAKKQMVEIARALVFTPKIVVFDEPTASLTDHEKRILFKIIHDLKAQGVGIVYISHRMDEIFEISDRISVLRDGQYRGTVNTAETDEDAVTRLMIGRSLEKVHYGEAPETGEVVLEVKGLTVPGLFDDIDLTVRRREIVGLYGLVGAGRSELAETVFGLRAPTSGEILLNGQPLVLKSPIDAIAAGIALVPEDRKGQGLVLGMNCRDNITLALLKQVASGGWLDTGKETQVYDKYQQSLAIKSPSFAQVVLNLSGGNQQKIVIGKWLATHPKLLILDEPTRGIDVGSKAEIHNLIRDLADEGYAVIVISSEMPEVMGVSDRILAMYAGRITAGFDARAVTEDDLIEAITGGH